MREKTATIDTPDGRMDTFVVCPDAAVRPAVIVYMDMWGVRDELYDIARFVAGEGFRCLVPDLYYRQGRLRFGRRDAEGRMISADRLDPADRAEVVGAMRRLSDAMVVRDTGALLAFLKDEPVGCDAVGVIGYCMGGRHAILAAAAYPERIRAAASLHGTFLVADGPESPHLAARRIRGELYCGFAERDPWGGPEVVRLFDETLRDGPVDYRREVHRGAGHGYALPERDIHDGQAAARDWTLIFDMFRRRLTDA